MDGTFEEFVDGQLPGLLGYARALTGHDADAWDLVQETLVRMGTRWARIDRGGNPAGYARTTLVRLNIDRHRRTRRETPSDAVPDRGVESEVPGIDPWLLAALRSLPVRQRTALVLRYVDDLDLAGVAAAMGCSVGTVKSQVSRGLAVLRSVAPEGSSFATTGGTDV